MSTKAALRYAKAILNLASENKAEETVNNDMQLINATIAESDDLKNLLSSPLIKVSDKVKTLDAIFGAKVNNFTIGLVKLLGENKRLDILATVASQYTIIYDFLKSREVAQVTTAVPLTKEIEAKVLAKVKELTGKEATIESTVNPDIIGGFILRVGDIQFDASVANSLRDLERSFDDSHYEAKI